MRHTARVCLSLTAAALLVAAGAVVTAPAALAADGPDPVFDHPVFNDPTGTESAQYAIFQQLAELIDRVPGGESIQMSWFEFKTPDWADTASKPNIITRLINAHQRGVNVRIILDNAVTADGKKKTDRNAVMPPYLKLSAELGTNTSASSSIMLCKADSGCIGKAKLGDANAYNHNKFLTASRVQLNDGTVKSNVVFQSSGNLSPTWSRPAAGWTWSTPPPAIRRSRR